MLNVRENIGQLDRRITFQQKVVGSNESNEDEETGWENIATNPTVWASHSDYRGNEQFGADKINAFQTSLFVIRYREDITVEMRILFDGLAYDIHSIEKIGRKRFLQISAESGYEYIENTGGAFSSAFSSAFDVATS